MINQAAKRYSNVHRSINYTSITWFLYTTKIAVSEMSFGHRTTNQFVIESSWCQELKLSRVVLIASLCDRLDWDARILIRIRPMCELIYQWVFALSHARISQTVEIYCIKFAHCAFLNKFIGISWCVIKDYRMNFFLVDYVKSKIVEVISLWMHFFFSYEISDSWPRLNFLWH